MTISNKVKDFIEKYIPLIDANKFTYIYRLANKSLTAKEIGELTQTLNGVYGELLIDTQRLSDNARRDWFKIDLNSNQLRVILTDYLKKLTTHRRDASAAFNDKKAESKRL